MPKTTRTSDINEIQTQLNLRLKYHPMRIFVYLILVGISSAFLCLSISYFATTLGTNFNKFKLPLLFHANTVIILVSSYAISQTRKAALNDDWENYLTGLLTTAGLGIAFTWFQIVGWKELMTSGIRLTNNVAGSYIYVISGLHIVHVLAGVGALIWFTIRALGRQNDPVKLLMFESDPFSKMKINLLCTYWHFVDGLWLYLYLFFVLNIYVFTKIHF